MVKLLFFVLLWIFFCSELTDSAVNYTWDPSNNIPIADAPAVPRTTPQLPDNPFLPPGLPSLFPPIPSLSSFLNDPWDVKVGSNTFYILIAIGVGLVIFAVYCFYRGRQREY